MLPTGYSTYSNLMQKNPAFLESLLLGIRFRACPRETKHIQDNIVSYDNLQYL